jgi:ATP-dependent DNA ligase
MPLFCAIYKQTRFAEGFWKSFILDGELVAYDPQIDIFLPFGTLKSSALRQYHISSFIRCYLGSLVPQLMDDD